MPTIYLNNNEHKIQIHSHRIKKIHKNNTIKIHAHHITQYTKPKRYQNSKQWKNNTQNYGLKRNHKPYQHQWHKLRFDHGGYLHTFLERRPGIHCSILLHLLLHLSRLPIESHSYKVHTTFKNMQIPRHWTGCSSMETNDLL